MHKLTLAIVAAATTFSGSLLSTQAEAMSLGTPACVRAAIQNTGADPNCMPTLCVPLGLLGKPAANASRMPPCAVTTLLRVLPDQSNA